MSPAPSPPAAAAPRAADLWPLALIVVAGLVAYANSFTGPFVFDDLPAVMENESIRRFSTALFPPENGSSVVGRPLVNLSFAINYAIGGYDPFGYHVVNLLIHLLAGLVLYGALRQSLIGPVMQKRADAARAIAAGGTLLWMVHPLLTESVVCVAQRTELFGGLFLLLTLYAGIRTATAPASRAWPLIAVFACLAGMLSKEIMVVAPLLVFLHDRTFIAGTFAAAWRARRGLYGALAATWIPLAWLVIATGGDRGGTSGFGTGVVTPWQYLLTQCEAIVLYLKLAFWPHPLVVDYGIGIVRDWRDVLPQALGLVTLASVGAWAVWRRPAWGFVATWFFAILAPSSSILPLATQTIAEHRMYLPLAAVTTAVALGCHALLGRRSVVVLVAVATVFAALTLRRNQDYASSLALWSATVEKAPHNVRARNNLGKALFDLGRHDEALARFQEAVQLDPTYPDAHFNLGLEFESRARLVEAERHYRETIRLHPTRADARMNLGSLLIRSRRLPEALAFSEESVRLLPGNASVHINLGVILQELQRAADALAPLQTAVRLSPDSALAHFSLANAFALARRPSEAATHYETALRLDPDYATAHENYGLLLLSQSKPAAAVPHFDAALRINPDNPVTRARLEFAREQIRKSRP